MAWDKTRSLNTGHATYSTMLEAFFMGENASGNSSTTNKRTGAVIAGENGIFGTDADGDYVDVPSSNAYSSFSINTTIPIGTAYSFLLVYKPETPNPGGSMTFQMSTGGAGAGVLPLLVIGHPDGYQRVLDSQDRPFPGSNAQLNDAGIRALLVTCDGSTAKWFVSGYSGSPITSPNTAANVGATPSRLTVGYDYGHNGILTPVKGKFYFWARWDSGLSDAEAAAIVSNPESLLSGGGGGPTAATAVRITGINATAQSATGIAGNVYALGADGWPSGAPLWTFGRAGATVTGTSTFEGTLSGGNAQLVLAIPGGVSLDVGDEVAVVMKEIDVTPNNAPTDPFVIATAE